MLGRRKLIWKGKYLEGKNTCDIMSAVGIERVVYWFGVVYMNWSIEVDRTEHFIATARRRRSGA
jgi:hypothetical protein